ncbi:prenyltransferase/squalene oxidase repeat-containing protein [Ferruginibacter sp.]|nr:hypothetical protein [Ferruginibacter sp.]
MESKADSLFTLYVDYIRKYLFRYNKDKAFKEIMSNDAFDSNKFFVLYISLFADAYKVSPTEEKVKELTVASYLYFYSILKLDSFVDGNTEKASFKNLYFIIQAQEFANQILTKHFPLDSKFWNKWTFRNQCFFSNVQREITDPNLYVSTNYKKYTSVVKNRNILALIAKDVIETLYLKDKDVIPELEIIHTNFIVAYQICDDILDFKIDYEHKQINFVAFLLIKNKKKGTQVPKLDDKVKYFYLSGLYKKAYAKIFFHLNKGIQVAKKLNANLWVEIINLYKAKVLKEYNALNGFIGVQILKHKLCSLPNSKKALSLIIFEKGNVSLIDNLKIKLANYLISQKNKGFGELKHIMFLGEEIGLDIKKSIHYNDTFQRALIADAVIDLENQFGKNYKKICEDEISYLIEKRNKDTIGGWSYFPSVPEIAADIDDLGQIVQVFSRAGKLDLIKKYCDHPIKILLDNNILPNGGIKTWIIPKSGNTEIQVKQKRFNKMWGAGPDTEVMANFLFGLCLYDYQRFEENIQKGASFILQKLNKAGYWESKWYYGNYYGTYVCLRLFGFLKTKKKSGSSDLQKSHLTTIIDFMSGAINSDGGVGLIKEKSDLLSTSLAILSLSYLIQLSTARQKIIAEKLMQKMVSYIIQNIDLNTYQAFSIPFIRPRIGDPYSSKTLTISYILKALESVKVLNNK